MSVMKTVILILLVLLVTLTTVVPTYSQEQPRRYLNIGADPQRPGGFKDKDIPPGWFRYINPRDIEIRSQDRHGRWTTAYLPAGREVIATIVSETPTKDGCVVRKYLYGWISDCGNQLKPIYVMITAKMRDAVVIEILEIKEKVIEKIVYRDREVEKIVYKYVPIVIKEVTTITNTFTKDRFIWTESGDIEQQPKCCKISPPNEGKSEFYTPPPLFNPNWYVLDIDNSNSNTANPVVTGGAGGTGGSVGSITATGGTGGNANAQGGNANATGGNAAASAAAAADASNLKKP